MVGENLNIKGGSNQRLAGAGERRSANTAIGNSSSSMEASAGAPPRPEEISSRLNQLTLELMAATNRLIDREIFQENTTNGVSDVPQEREVTCPICFEQFGEEHAPRTLRCGHSVCTPCLETILTRTAGDRNCPECRRPLKVTAVAHIPVSYTIMRLARALEETCAAAAAGRLAEDFPYGQQAIKDRKKRRQVNQATANTNEASSSQASAATDVDSLTTNDSVAKDPVLPVPTTESPTSAGARKKSRVPVSNASQIEAVVTDNARPLPPVPLEASAEESNLNLGAALSCSVVTSENTEFTKKKLDLEIELLKKQVETASATAEIERARAEIERAKAEIERSKAGIEKARAEVEKRRAELELLRLNNERDILVAKSFM